MVKALKISTISLIYLCIYTLLRLDPIVYYVDAFQIDIIMMDIKRVNQLSYFCQEGSCESPDLGKSSSANIVFGGVPTILKVIGLINTNLTSVLTLNSLKLDSASSLFGPYLKFAFAKVPRPTGSMCDEYKVTEAYTGQARLLRLPNPSNDSDIPSNRVDSSNLNNQQFLAYEPFEAYINVSLPILNKPDKYYQLCVKQGGIVVPNSGSNETLNKSIATNANDNPGSTWWVFADPSLRVQTLLKRSRYILPYKGLQIFIVISMFLISGLFSGLTIGLLSLDPTELTLVLKSGTPKERQCAKVIVPLRRRGNFLLCSLVLGNVLVNAALTLLLENLSSGTIAVVVSTLGITIFGEILPQAICTRHGLEIGARTVWITKFFMFVTAPLSLPLSWCLDWLLGEDLGSVYDRQRLVELVKMMAGSSNNGKAIQTSSQISKNINQSTPLTIAPNKPDGAKGGVKAASLVDLLGVGPRNEAPVATTNYRKGSAASLKAHLMSRIRWALHRRQPNPSSKRQKSFPTGSKDGTECGRDGRRLQPSSPYGAGPVAAPSHRHSWENVSAWTCRSSSTNSNGFGARESNGRVLRQDEVDIITGALDMVTKTVGEIMTPLDNVFAIGYDSTLDFATMAAIVNSGFTRVPVYRDPNRADVIGLLNFKDLAFVDPSDRIPLRTLLKFYNHVVTYVFEDTPLCSILEEFKKGESHMAFVRRVVTEDEKDPWYEIVGLVTLEDVIEEIIQSEIWDETDKMVDAPNNKRTEKRRTKHHGFSLFWKPDSMNDSGTSKLTPQMALVAFQYLKANIEAFKEDRVSSGILRKLLRRPSVVVIVGDETAPFQVPSDSEDSSYPRTQEPDSTSNSTAPKVDPGFSKRPQKPNYLYTKGRPANYFVLVLEGKIRVYAGQEDICFDTGPFSYFGLQALSLPPSSLTALHNESAKYSAEAFFVPDYTVIPVTNRLIYLKIRADHYDAVVKASYIERERAKEQPSFYDGASLGPQSSDQRQGPVAPDEPESLKQCDPLNPKEAVVVVGKADISKREKMIRDFLTPTPRASPKISRNYGGPSATHSAVPVESHSSLRVPSMIDSHDVHLL